MYQGFQLTGKNAIVTGGTRGIGLAIAKGFLESGAKVIICSRKQENVDSALAEFGGPTENIQGIAAHVGKSADLERIVSVAERRFGSIEILVNNAGTNPYVGPVIDADEAVWDKTMDVNLKGPYLLSSLCATKMMENGGGSIINVASVAGLNASPLQGIYSISKAGLIMLTKVLARELGSHKIRVNCICPGLIKTRLSEAIWSNPELAQAAIQMKALGRAGRTEELVGTAIYLASDASSFTTGATIQVDGGMMI